MSEAKRRGRAKEGSGLGESEVDMRGGRRKGDQRASLLTLNTADEAAARRARRRRSVDAKCSTATRYFPWQLHPRRKRVHRREDQGTAKR